MVLLSFLVSSGPLNSSFWTHEGRAQAQVVRRRSSIRPAVTQAQLLSAKGSVGMGRISEDSESIVDISSSWSGGCRWFRCGRLS